LVPPTFLGLTGGRAGGYGLIGVCVDAEDKVDKVAGQENKNGVRVGVELAYRGVVDCAVKRREA
jgi:hypothetical protein